MVSRKLQRNIKRLLEAVRETDGSLRSIAMKVYSEEDELDLGPGTDLTSALLSMANQGSLSLDNMRFSLTTRGERRIKELDDALEGAVAHGGHDRQRA